MLYWSQPNHYTRLFILFSLTHPDVYQHIIQRFTGVDINHPNFQRQWNPGLALADILTQSLASRIEVGTVASFRGENICPIPYKVMLGGFGMDLVDGLSSPRINRGVTTVERPTSPLHV